MKFSPAVLTLNAKEYEKITSTKTLLEEIAQMTSTSADYENLSYFAKHAASYIEDLLTEYNAVNKEDE